MSLRNGRMAARKATRAGRRDVLRRACQTAIPSARNVAGFEPLENRVLMTIVQPAGQDYLAFEAESLEGTIAPGSNSSTWTRVTGAPAAGNTTVPYGGGAIRASRSGGDVNVLDAATVSYPIQLTDAGPYNLYIRTKYVGGGDNSMYVPPTGPVNGAPATPTYDNRTEALGDYHWNLDPGDVRTYTNPSPAAPTTFTIRMRENGYMVDRIVLSKTAGLTAAQLDEISPFSAIAGTARSDQLGIRVAYTPVEGADSYNIYRGNAVGGPFTKLNTDVVTDLSFLDTTGTIGTTYFYNVKPVTGGVEGAASNTTSAVFGAGASGHYFEGGFWGNGTGFGNRPANPFTGTGATATEVGGTIAVQREGDVVEFVPQVAFDYGDGANGTPGSPAPGAIGPDNHSTVFVGKVRTNEAGSYTFGGFGDDDTHVYVNGVLVSSDPGGHGIPGAVADLDYLKPITLAADTEYDFVILQSEGGGGSGVFLRWATPTNTAFNDIPSGNLRTTNTAPAAPTGVTYNATGTRGGVEIRFTDAATSELRYELQRSTGGGAFETVGSPAAIAGINASRIFDPTAVVGQTYQYRVRAWNFAGSTDSAPITVTVVAPTGTAGASGFYFNDQWWGNSAAPPQFQPLVADGDNADFREVVPQVLFNYGESSPAPGIIQNDQHSTVFTGTLVAPVTGVYQIQAQTDDDSYLYINNQLVSADPGGHGIRVPTTINPITLTAGQPVNFVAFQSEGGGGSGILMRWVVPGTTALVDIPATAYASSLPNAAPDQASGAPAQPGNFQRFEAGASRVALTWTDVSTNETRYVLERSTDAAFTNPDVIVLPVQSRQYIDTGLAPSTPYFYRLRAENFFGDGPNATLNFTSAATDPVPTAPSSVNARPRASGILISWVDNSFFEDSYSVQRRTGTTGAFAEIGTVPGQAGAGSPMSFEDTTAEAGTTYQYQVVAINAAGNSTPGGPVTATPATQGGTGLAARYFSERFFTGPFVDVSPEIADQNFADGGPDGLVADPRSPNPNDTFSGVFEGYFLAETTEPYTFLTASDDGVSLMVIDPDNGQVLVDYNNLQALRGISAAGTFQDVAGTANLTAGKKYYILGRFTENGGGAAYRFGFRTPTTPGQPINTDLLFLPTGNEAVAAPRNFRVANGFGNEVLLAWDDLSISETGYELQRSTSATGPWTTIATVAADQTSFQDTVAGPVFYQIRTTGTAGNSAYAGPLAYTPTAVGGRQITLNGSAVYMNGADNTRGTPDDSVRLTDNLNSQSGTFFTSNVHDTNVAGMGTAGASGFTTSFDFVIPEGTDNPADGLTFLIQRNNPNAVGGGGGGLAYSGIDNSFAVKFDTWPTGDDGGRNATGLYANGYLDDDGVPTGLEFFRGAGFHVDMSYDATAHTLTQTITSKADPNVSFTNTYTEVLVAATTAVPVDVAGIIGGEFAYVGITSATGGANEEVHLSNFTFNGVQLVPQPEEGTIAHVTQVFVNGQNLTANAAFRGAAGVDPTFGYPLPDGTNQLRPIPWVNGINAVSLRFDQNVAGALDQADLAVRGSAGPLTTSGFTYDAATRTGTWTLSAPVTLDKLRLVLSAAGVAGLDGDWTNPTAIGGAGDTYPSGNGTAGGDFNFRLNVLRGDATGDGTVNALDLADVKRRLGRRPGDGTTGAGAYSIFSDITMDGVVNALDLAAVKQRLGNRLPTPEPALFA